MIISDMDVYLRDCSFSAGASVHAETTRKAFFVSITPFATTRATKLTRDCLSVADTSMALSMAIDLGVHVDGLKPDSLDALEVEVRKRLFWSCYVVSADSCPFPYCFTGARVPVLTSAPPSLAQWDKSISVCLGRSPRFLKQDRSFLQAPPECA